MSAFEVHAICSRCGWWERAPFGDPWFVASGHGYACPGCGHRWDRRFPLDREVRRWAFNGTWWNPWTWFRWDWQPPMEPELEDATK